MIKIKNGNIVISDEKKFTVETNVTATRFICVLNGSAAFNGEKLERGSCVIVPNNSSAKFEAETPLSYAWIDVDGFDKTQTDVVSVTYPDKIELLAKLVSDASELSDIDDSFFESAAKMLLSLAVSEDEMVSTGNKHVDMAKRYIDRNFSTPIKVEEIAEHIGVDRKYLRNLFFRYVGVSTKDYLMNIRIERAKELLVNSDLSVSDVAMSVGYPDALAFSKIFKKHTELSPTEYRMGEEPEKREKTEEKKPAQKKEDIKYFLL